MQWVSSGLAKSRDGHGSRIEAGDEAVETVPRKRVQMTARVLDGKATAAAIKAELAGPAAALAARGHRPKLAAVLVGDDEASRIYVGGKRRDAEACGMDSLSIELPANARQEQVMEAVASLNADVTVHGIIVQLPLPEGLDPVAVQDAIDPTKDVDGLHPCNAGLLLRGDPRFVPCTPAGIVELLVRNDVAVAGRHVVIVGRGLLVGRPLGLLLSAKGDGANATVTLCHTGTRDLASFTRSADIVVAAAGRPGMITADMVSAGVVIVDVGIHRTEAGLIGDVHPDVAEVASAMTPVPGGVGPMTRALLLVNTLRAAHAQALRYGAR